MPYKAFIVTTWQQFILKATAVEYIGYYLTIRAVSQPTSGAVERGVQRENRLITAQSSSARGKNTRFTT